MCSLVFNILGPYMSSLFAIVSEDWALARALGICTPPLDSLTVIQLNLRFLLSFSPCLPVLSS